MQEILSITIKYTLKDLREFSFAKARMGILKKILFFFSVFVTALFILAIPALVSDFSEGKGSFFILLLLIFPVLFFWGFQLFPAFMLYQRHSSNFRKSKLLGVLQCFKIFEDKLEICSENGSFSLQWSDVYKIQELKPCIIIQSSPGKMFLIPRRCFGCQEQLDLFLKTLESKIDKKKIKLKRYRLRKSMPDYGEIKAYESTSQTVELEYGQEEPIAEIQFSFTKNEYIAMNFRFYYTKPVGLIVSAIGIILIAASMRVLLLSGSVLIAPLLLGIAFTFLTPLMLLKNSIKLFERDSALQKPYVYKIYEDCFVVEHPSGTNRIRFCDLVKVTEIKTALLFFATTQIAHIIPKRVFEGREDELNKLKDIIQRKVPAKNQNILR